MKMESMRREKGLEEDLDWNEIGRRFEKGREISMSQLTTPRE
jgi:hypothetical protein